ncbi:CubicO group peptidase, beta-lactamase class C family [Mucilaginibacter gossypiicola]|uniref:CubicO group peptidase, beta-lactamase class C family n=1 Tax=Mucilaginibacter gossypiicola TaxID=551995 RepID=A0A1H8M1G1_9SPHI|nr:serine hydrolase domain-containing protein [Mucilaginibacter gossypiicola]SEO11120.1 CubicO group peptidase, beta-lactamase class C family [Mucilaginibacter gossypiicola]
MKKVILFILVTSITQTFAQTARRLDSLFQVLDTSRTFNGNVLVAENKHVIYNRSVGYADLNTKKKHTINSAFQIGSVSKTITALAILQLVEQHKIRLDDQLKNYFKEIPYPDLTVYHLLTHTSGLPDKEELFFPLIDKNAGLKVDNQDIIPALQNYNKSLAFTPGSQWRYNNIGYALLALLVEKVSGQPFNDYIMKHIFFAAGMKNSYLLGNRATDSNRVTGYLIRHHYLGDMESIENNTKVRRWSYNLRALYGPTNVISTTGDLMKFAQALDGGKLLSKALLDKAWTACNLNDGTAAAPGGEFGPSSYGLGWYLPTTNLGKMAMHTGREPGFFTFFWHDISRHKTIILLDNAESNGFGKACKETLNAVYGQTYFKPEQKGKQSLFLPYIKLLVKEGPDAAASFYNRLKTDTLRYFTDERELNELGLELLADHHETAALEALKLGTLLYPQSWNTYDSYGKALLQAGRKVDAIEMYRKSVVMFPGNLPGKAILTQLTNEK